MEKKHQKYIAIAAAVVVVLVLVPILFFTFVGEHEVGIEVRNGRIVGERRTGLNVSLPVVSTVETIPIIVQQGAIEDVSSATIDNYEVAASTIEYLYRVPEERAIDIYREYPNYEELIEAELEDATKDVIGQYRMMSIPENREQIGLDIAETMRERLTDEMGVEFRTAALAYYEWTPDAAQILGEIQEAQTLQDVEEERIETSRLEQEREEMELQARLEREEEETESQARRRIREAEANAEAELIEAEAEAEAMAVIAEVLSENPDLLYRQQIEKWDGTLPMVSGGETSSRFDFDMNLQGE